MKSFQRLITAVLIMFSSVTLAVQVTVEDISNQAPQCYDGSNKNSPLKRGDCYTVPKGTVQVAIQLEENEPLELLDNVHVIIESNGQFLQYGTRGGPTWEAVSIGGLMTSPELKTSYSRFPPDAPHRVSIRDIYLDNYYTKGTKIHVGVRTNDSAGFLQGSVKEAFEVR